MSDIFTVMDMLDHMTQEEISRMKVETSDALEEGSTEKTYHHGRCDVGSPFATGKLYDLEEEEGAETPRRLLKRLRIEENEIRENDQEIAAGFPFEEGQEKIW